MHISDRQDNILFFRQVIFFLFLTFTTQKLQFILMITFAQDF